MTSGDRRSETASPLRAFLAIPLDDSVLDSIASIQQRLQAGLPDVRWTRRENLHLTLRFFGDIAEEDLEKASKIVVSVGSLFAPFPLHIGQIGAFPSPDRARIVWLGVQSPDLTALYRSLQRQFAAAGFPTEHRRFRPHITIGRSRRGTGRILSQQQDTVAGTMEVSELILYESRLQATGAEHIPRHTVRLAEPGHA